MSEKEVGGVVFESSENEETLGPIDPKKMDSDFLFFGNIEVEPRAANDNKIEDEAAVLAGLEANNITIEAIPKEEREKFGLDLDSHQIDHLKQAA